MGDFSFKAFANYKPEEVNNQGVDVPSMEIPSQQISWPTSQYVATEKNVTSLGVVDKVFSGGAWLEPKMYMVRNEKKDFSPRKIFQDIIICMRKYCLHTADAMVWTALMWNFCLTMAIPAMKSRRCL
jgi:hypothetical protein